MKPDCAFRELDEVLTYFREEISDQKTWEELGSFWTGSLIEQLKELRKFAELRKSKDSNYA